MNKAVLKIIITTGVLAFVRLADAQQAIFLVRHAEDVRSKDVVDRPLTESGQRRATLLAEVLKDAGIDAIFTSSLQRAVKTAEPLAIASRIEPKPLPQLTTKFDKSDMENSFNFSAANTAATSYCLSVTRIPSQLCSKPWDTLAR